MVCDHGENGSSINDDTGWPWFHCEVCDNQNYMAQGAFSTRREPCHVSLLVLIFPSSGRSSTGQWLSHLTGKLSNTTLNFNTAQLLVETNTCKENKNPFKSITICRKHLIQPECHVKRSFSGHRFARKGRCLAFLFSTLGRGGWRWLFHCFLGLEGRLASDKVPRHRVLKGGSWEFRTCGIRAFTA